MVIGNGLMGSIFSNYKADSNILIFASGVSNSSTKKTCDFEREKQLFLDVVSKHSDKKVIYFSTCSVYDVSMIDNYYVKHKLNMESLVKEYCSSYIIFRVSNVVGKLGNSNTLINYFVKAVANNIKIDIWKNAERNIIDIEDVKYIVESKINLGVENRIVNVAVRKSELVTEILHQIELYLNKNSTTNIILKGSSLDIDTEEIKEELFVIESKKGKGLKYISNLLDKYYERDC